MAHSIELATHHKRLCPPDPYKSMAEQFQVRKTTFYSRIKCTQYAPNFNIFQAWSPEQEHILVEQISLYATRSTLLTPSHVHELAEAFAEHKTGLNWVSHFAQCQKEPIHLCFYAYQEPATLKAKSQRPRGRFIHW